jgi:hypothetical protein
MFLSDYYYFLLLLSSSTAAFALLADETRIAEGIFAHSKGAGK